MSDNHDASEDELHIRAMVSLLIDKGTITQEMIDGYLVELSQRGYTDGSRLVARAWVDPEFKQRLLTDAKSAAAELDIDASSIPQFEILENTPDRHHVIVCTLCSCYPRPVLGLPPDWYKSVEYRGRVVREPRVVLEEFGLTLPDDVEVVVVDSTADLRYMVLPRRPEGTEGMSEEELARLVNRDSLVGVAQADSPREPANA